MSRLRAGVDRIADRIGRGRDETWFADLTCTGDGLARLAGENDSPGLTLEEYAELPDNPRRQLVELVDEPEPEAAQRLETVREHLAGVLEARDAQP